MSTPRTSHPGHRSGTGRSTGRAVVLLALVLGLLGAGPVAPTSAAPTAPSGTVAATDLAATDLAAAGTLTSARKNRTVRLGGVRVRLRRGTTQVITVNRRSGIHATVAFWRRTDDGWQRRMKARDGRIGYGGLVGPTKREQGTGTTPVGTYRLPFAFGTRKERDNWQLDYRRIKAGDYWVQDNESDYYNEYRNKRRGGFRWWLSCSDPDCSERLADYPTEYEYAVVVNYNAGKVRHRGAGIFLHVNGDGATAGCVSAPRWFLRGALARLDDRGTPVIAIGG
ncbi:hypothetical protein [Nocardioides bruguierae]|uniref:YkuD domain-containing protein n=1 Tax=Nocardioides bruguierae TaxID=2945102 RepID=A0A9X2D7D7_9ACTN|nr:hypothetical protein [Nocardioides bruguierae]MCM0620525.1 hypothetical protein [Nocardioides bruguierae]